MERECENLSGGEMQMVAIARALVGAPGLILFDEPSQGLAPKIVGDVLATIRRLREEGVASLIVEQNAEIALSVADHAAVIDRGRIAWTGDAATLREDGALRQRLLGVHDDRAAARARPRPQGLHAGRIVRRPTFTLEADLVIDRAGDHRRGRAERRRQDHAVRDDDRLQRAVRRAMSMSRAPTSTGSSIASATASRSTITSPTRSAASASWCRPRCSRRRRPQHPMVHLFDEPQFNLQDGYIGFMLDFFRKLRAEGKLVVLCLHPTASWHLEILAEIAEQFLLVANGGVTRQPDFRALVNEPRFRNYLGPEMTRAAEAMA